MLKQCIFLGGEELLELPPVKLAAGFVKLAVSEAGNMERLTEDHVRLNE